MHPVVRNNSDKHPEFLEKRSMIRDWDLIRKILLQIELHRDEPLTTSPKIENYTDEEIAYALTIMQDAKFFEATITKRNGVRNPMIVPTRLTWEGHDFLDAARDEDRWCKAKKIISDNMGGNVPFDVLNTILLSLMMSQIPK
jgi:hypothetical protein